MPPPDLADEMPEMGEEEIAAIRHFARRAREQESAESKLLQRWSERAALAKLVYSFAAGVVTLTVAATVYLLQLKNDVAANRHEIEMLRAELVTDRATIAALSVSLVEVRLKMENKADRPK